MHCKTYGLQLKTLMHSYSQTPHPIAIIFSEQLHLDARHQCANFRVSTPRQSCVLACDSSSNRSSFGTVSWKCNSRLHDFDCEYLRFYSSHCAQIWRACSCECLLHSRLVSCQLDSAFSIEQMRERLSSMHFRPTVQHNFRSSYLSFLWTDFAEIWTGSPQWCSPNAQWVSSLTSQPLSSHPEKENESDANYLNWGALLSINMLEWHMMT